MRKDVAMRSHAFPLCSEKPVQKHGKPDRKFGCLVQRTLRIVYEHGDLTA
jgi:hypothetical protein